MSRRLLPALVFSLLISCNRSPDAYVKKGNDLLAAGQYADAALNYSKALQKDPRNGEACYKLGLIAVEQGKGPDALGFLARAVELMPENDEAKAKFADVNISAYQVAGQQAVFYDRIRKMADQLLARNPNSFDGLRLSGTLALLDRKHQDAIPFFQRANSVKPLQPAVIVPWMRALALNGQRAEGEKLALQLVESRKDFGPIYDELFNLYAAQNRAADADAILRRKVENNPAQAQYRLQLASLYSVTGRPDQVKPVLQPLIDDRKTFPMGLAQAGDFYAGAGKMDEALRLFAEGIRSDPARKAEYQKRTVSVLLVEHKSDEAAAFLQAALKEHPENGDLLALKSTLLLESGKPEDAAAAATQLKALLQKSPGDPQLHFNLGRAMAASGQTDGARKELSESINRDRTFLPAKLMLSQLALAGRDYQTALEQAEAVLQVQPGNREALLNRAAAMAGLGRSAEARNGLAEALRRDPAFLDAEVRSAYLRLADREFGAAEAAFRAIAKKAEGRIPATLGLVDVRLAQNQPQPALDLLAGEVKKTPDSLELKQALAGLALRTGHAEVAVKQYQELQGTRANGPGLQLGLGQAQLLAKDLAGAIQTLEKLTKETPTDSRAISLLGDAYSAAGRHEEARQRYLRVLELTPNDASALNNLAYERVLRGGNLDEALKWAQQAVAKDPNNFNYRDTLGSIYLEKKMYDPALQIFTELVSKQPASAVFRYSLGRTLLAKGDKARGRKELAAALKLGPGRDTEGQIKRLMESID